MSLKEWQCALRRQAAESETFGIIPPSHKSDPFVVGSAKSGKKYRVNYYGLHSPLNRCECMDFKTSGLGVCKHIAAVSRFSGGRYARMIYDLPDYPYVYVDYRDGRKVKLYKGMSASKEMEELAARLFDSDCVIKDMVCDPSEFIREATKLDERFEWEQDALNLVIDARDRERRRKIIDRKYSGTRFDGLLKTVLHPYQAEGVRFAFTEGRTINADEMGLGKTVQAIATAELLRKEGFVESVLIICPTSLKYQWQAEIKRFTDSSVLVVEGHELKRREALSDRRYFYKICSFHAMSNSVKAGFIPETDMIIYDELQRLKNRATQMGIQLRKLRSPYVMALSGTPLENRLEELYSVTQFVDQFILGPLYQFNADTTLRDETGKVVGYRNLHSVANRLSHTMIRRRKADVRLQMPARTDTNMYVPMTNEQMAIHDDYKAHVARLIYKWRRLKFLNEKDRKRLLLFLSIMRMVCDSTFILDQKSRYDTKIDELLEIINNLFCNDEGKVVIFSQWERMLRIISQELDAKGMEYCFLHGGVPSPKRKDLIDRFREDLECRIFLSTDAGATGLNLQTASLLVNIDLPWNPAVLEQRIARIYRLGQKNPVQIINMVARGTIEERMLSTLDFKSNLAAGILDGGDDAVFLENKKFDKIVEVLEDVISDEDTATSTTDADAPIDTIAETPQAADVSQTTNTPQAADTPVDTPVSAPHPEAVHRHGGQLHTASESQQSDSAPNGKPRTPQTPDEIRSMVAGGMGLLGSLAKILKEPESAKALADVLVTENPDTGKATLNIPVPDKTTVVNILNVISVMLNRSAQ